VIAGWTEGLQLVREGGTIELEIPPSLGYGETGTASGSIPPNATLRFIVELHSIA
jgi:FKBP-type peptidyl-prolyl cis-trans isomerase FkpA